MSELPKIPTDGNGVGAASQREASQVTLSAIGDMSVAATNALGGVSKAPPRTRWLPILGFLLLVYMASSYVAIYSLHSKPWVRAFLAPLLPVLNATLVFWRRQAWKFRARGWRIKERERQDALNSLAHEAANGLNAIRANLADFREVNLDLAAGEHLEQVDHAPARVEAAVEKAEANSQSQSTLSAQGAAKAPKSNAA